MNDADIENLEFVAGLLYRMEMPAWERAVHAAVGELRASRWISVEGRLPAISDEILISGLFGVEPGRRFDEELYYVWERAWRDAASVTHWMPLPDPPDK